MHCFADRIVTEGGRAAGVEATYVDPGHRRAAPASRSARPRVVVAAGSLESPALLLRSGIGGPAVGENLRLHPCTAVFGSYGEDQRALVGRAAGRPRGRVRRGRGRPRLPDRGHPVRARHRGVGRAVHERRGAQGADAPLPLRGHLHRPACATAVRAGSPWTPTARPCPGTRSPTSWTCATRSARSRPRSACTTRAARARSSPLAGGHAPLAPSATTSSASSSAASAIPLRAGGYRLFSAHQMGTCRMGTDPATSVAGPERRAPRHPRRVDRRRKRLPHQLGNQSDDHDHGPRPENGRGDTGVEPGHGRDGALLRRTSNGYGNGSTGT